MVFKRSAPRLHASNEKPEEEREIEDEARVAIGESREQINRARNILKKEVQRIDRILVRGNND